MKKSTHQKLKILFAQESESHARNQLYAKRARIDDRLRLSDCLSAVASAEDVHSRRVLMHLRGKMKDLQDYCEELLEKKREDAENLFPELSTELEADGRKTPAEMLEQFGKVAANHAKLLSEAMTSDPEKQQQFYVCQVCGYILTQGRPGRCPVCEAVSSRFKLEASS